MVRERPIRSTAVGAASKARKSEPRKRLVAGSAAALAMPLSMVSFRRGVVTCRAWVSVPSMQKSLVHRPRAALEMPAAGSALDARAAPMQSAVPRQGSAWSSRLGPGSLALGLGVVALQGRLKAMQASRGARRLHAVAVEDKVSVELVTDEVVKPRSDLRDYRVLKLPNGLEVLLASDPAADMSAAAVTIRAGTFQDTEDRPGLAHFHEHMLFLGTEKYPEEDEYSKYLNEHAGDSNAFTMNEYTTYYFKVASPYLHGALDRFAQFFVAPKFDESCVEREMNAVDSESTNYSTEDPWRFLQLQKCTVAEDHPFSRFDVGNLSTLGSDDPQSTRSQIIAWNQEHYQAGAMKLVVLGRDSLDELQEMAQELFGSIRPGEGVKQDYQSLPWPQDKLGRIIYTVPLKETRSMSIHWPLPPRSKYPFGKPELYISHVLGHEGPGSLHDVLNARGWVDQLSAGPVHSFSDSMLFTVNITLTQEGDEHRDEVLALFFQYVKLMQEAGPREAYFRELAAMQEIEFSHKEDTAAPDSFASGATHALFHYPPKEALRGPFAVDEWLPEVVSEYLDMMRVDKCLVFVASQSFAEEAGINKEQPDGEVASGWKREKWYKAPYKEVLIDEEVVKRWEVVAEDSGLSLMQPNPFIPQDFALKGIPQGETPSGSKLPEEVTPPGLVEERPFLRLWHKTDETFATPREYVYSHGRSAAYEAGPEVVAMVRLFCNVVIDDLNSFSYDASVAGLGYVFDFSEHFSLSIGGFNDKLTELLEVVTGRIREVLDEAEAAAETEDGVGGERGQELLQKLESQRDLLLLDYKNFTIEEPWSVCSYYSSQILMPGSWHLDEYIEVLEKPSSLGAMATAVRTAMAQLQVETLVHGNVTAKEAKGATKLIEDTFAGLGAKPLPQPPKRNVLKLPCDGTTVFEYDLAAKNPAQENCCTENVYQVGVTIEDKRRTACLVVVCHIAGTSCYDQLRTKEQLGYIVQAWCWQEHYVSGLGVLVQGPRLPPDEVDVRIEAWLASFHSELETMSEEDFKSNVDAVVKERTQRLARLSQETMQHWAEIVTRRYHFERLRESLEALRTVTKEEILDFFSEYLAAGAPQRRKLSLRILGTSATQAAPSEEAEATSEDASEETAPPPAPEKVGRVLKSLEEIRDFHKSCDVFPEPPSAEPPRLGD